MRPEQPTSRRVDASMTLLTELLERPLDGGYARAAQRRGATGGPGSTGERSGLFVLTLLVIGLVLGASASALRSSATARSDSRTGLIKQIEAARESVDDKAAQVTALNAEIADRDAQLLASMSLQQSTEMQLYTLTTGAVPVHGPGLVVTIDDAPRSAGEGSNSDPRSAGRAEDGVVRARDLQIIVNGLWAAGAEAVMINGQRLTATSAIRFAGQAIIVNYRPLVRPYVISAIGDPTSLPARFADGTGGAYIATLKGTYGIVVDAQRVERVSLPAAASVRIRVAQPAATTASTSTPTASTPTGGAP